MTANSKKIGEINVTPMIDVLLVLLVIFMVITPRLSTGLDASLPQTGSGASNQIETQIVLEITKDHKFLLNGEAIERRDLPAEVAKLYHTRANQQLFIRAQQDVEYSEVAMAMDDMRGADRSLRFGLLTTK